MAPGEHPDTEGALLEVLVHAARVRCPLAPHVAGALIAALGADRKAIIEVAQTLSPAVRRGAAFLPDPLPLTPAVGAVFEPLVLGRQERQVLLIAALGLDDRLELLHEAAGAAVTDVARGPLAGWLSLRPGGVVFPDRRIIPWVLARATPAEVAAAHGRWAAVHRRRNDGGLALWHAASAGEAFEPSDADALLAAARRLAASDRPAVAFAAAKAAAALTSGAARWRALRTAGIIALRAGCVDDAASALEEAFVVGDADRKAWVAADLSLALYLRDGVVPAPAAQGFPRGCGSAVQRRGWARVAAQAAVLASLHGRRGDARAWLGSLDRMTAAERRLGGLRSLTRTWTHFLEGEEAIDTCLAETAAGGLLDALRVAIDGDIDAGIALLSDWPVPSLSTAPHADVDAGRAPILRAHRVVALALLWFWRGDVHRAYRVLADGAANAPVGLVVGGIGVAVARRLELALHGRPRALSTAAATCWPGRIDRYVDRGIRAHLAGDAEAAALHMALWHERGAPQGRFALPGLDEVGPIRAVAAVEPADLARARALRGQVRAAGEGAWEDISESGSDLCSPFERGRLESLIGEAWLRRGDERRALSHLRRAQSLFAEAGAWAWQRAVHERMSRVAHGDRMRHDDDVARAVRAADPLATCRADWGALLSARELEIAMLVVDGIRYRDIAQRLSISVRTVEVHVRSIFRKLDVRDRHALTILAHRIERFA